MDSVTDVDIGRFRQVCVRQVDNPEKLSRELGFAMIDQDLHTAWLRR